MRTEVYAASEFIVGLLRTSGACQLNDRQLDIFRDTLVVLMRNHYRDHWFPNVPIKGSGYRCIRINGQMDPLVAAAGDLCGLERAHLRSLFPGELTLWVDPREVSYRIGEDGSICVLYEVQQPAAPVMAPSPDPLSGASTSSMYTGGLGQAWLPAQPTAAALS